MRWIKGRNRVRPGRVPKPQNRWRWLVWIANPGAAAWVQAIGAIVALYLTLHMAVQAKEDSRMRAMMIVEESYIQFAQAAGRARQACSNNDLQSFRTQLTRTDSAISMMNGVQAADLPVVLIDSTFTARESTSKLRAELERRISLQIPTEALKRECEDVFREILRSYRKPLRYVRAGIYEDYGEGMPLYGTDE